METLFASVHATSFRGSEQVATCSFETTARTAPETHVIPATQMRLFRTDLTAPLGKWVDGVSRKHSVQEAARLILSSRLSTVLYWLPLAAHKSDEDVEYVHQLRVATRRAAEAVRMFSNFLPASAGQEIRATLREVRLAANEARDLDVLLAECLNGAEGLSADACWGIVDAIRERRKAAQQPVMEIHQKLLAEAFDDRIESILREVPARRMKKFKQSFGRWAPHFLKPAVKKFFQAAEADLSDENAFHELRIRAKKLRYTMEHVAAAFKPHFTNRLYAEISSLQDTMGAVNDHATAKIVFGNWIAQTDDDLQRAFFRGMLLAERKAHEDLRQAFQSTWTPKVVTRLRRQFHEDCGRLRL